MKLLRVFLKNVGSWHGEHTLNLADRGLVALIGRNFDAKRAFSEGSGKTTPLDAIDWCVWGKTASDRDLVSWEVGGDLAVVVDFLDGDVGIRIARYRDVPGVPDGPQLWVNGAAEGATDPKETQRRIEEVLGLDYDVWHAAVLFPQIGRTSWATATDGQRKALLGRILPDLDTVEGMLDGAKAKAQQAQVLLSGKKARIDALTTQKSSVEPQLVFLRQQESNFAATEKQRIDGLQQQLAAAAAAGTDATNRLNAAAAERATWQPLTVPTPPSPTHDEAAAMSKATSERDAAMRAAGAAQSSYSAAKDAQTTKTCHACKRPFPPSSAPMDLTTFVQCCDSANVLVQQANIVFEATQAAVYTQQKQRMQEHASQMQAVNAEQQRRHSVNDAGNKAQADRDAAAANWRHVNHALQQPSPANPFTSQIATVMQSIALIENEAVALQGQVQVEERRARVLAFWVGAFGPKGLRSFLLDAHLGAMTQEINRWLMLLTGGTTWATMSTHRTSGKGKAAKVIEQITLRMHERLPDGAIIEHDLGDRSGGEQFRVTLAVDFSISRLIAKRARKQFDFLAFDEVFRHIDDVGREAVLDLLKEVAKERSTVLIVEHDRNLQAAIPHRIVVEKKARRSRIALET